MSIIALCAVTKFVNNVFEWYAIVLIVIFSTLLLVSSVLIWLQPQITSIKTFRVPLVPFLPSLGVIANTYMMMTLSVVTWARFIIWFLLGIETIFDLIIKLI